MDALKVRSKLTGDGGTKLGSKCWRSDWLLCISLSYLLQAPARVQPEYYGAHPHLCSQRAPEAVDRLHQVGFRDNKGKQSCLSSPRSLVHPRTACSLPSGHQKGNGERRQANKGASKRGWRPLCTSGIVCGFPFWDLSQGRSRIAERQECSTSLLPKSVPWNGHCLTINFTQLRNCPKRCSADLWPALHFH